MATPLCNFERKHTEQLHTANLSEDLLGEDLILGNGRDVNFSLRHFELLFGGRTAKGDPRGNWW